MPSETKGWPMKRHENWDDLGVDQSDLTDYLYMHTY